MNISKRDIEKMIEYYTKGSNPEILAKTVKDLDKAKARAVIANAMGWKGCSRAFIYRCEELGASDAEIAEVERLCDTYELPSEYRARLDNGPKLEDVSRLRNWFPKFFKVLRDHKVQNIKVAKRTPTDRELYKDRTNGLCYTLAYTVSFDYNGKHFDWKIANHTNEAGGSYGVSSSSLGLSGGNQQALADHAESYLNGETTESKINLMVNRILEGVSVRAALMEDDQEYWDYVHTYDYGVSGHESEVESAADYFDVSPSAFEETYAQFFELDDDALEEDNETYSRKKEVIGETEALWSKMNFMDIVDNTSKFQRFVKNLCSNVAVYGDCGFHVMFGDSYYSVYNNDVYLDLCKDKNEVEVNVNSYIVARFSSARYKMACNRFRAEIERVGKESSSFRYIFVSAYGWRERSVNSSKNKPLSNPFFIGKDLEIELKKLETDDYQNRGGDGPKSGKPDTISVYKNDLTFTFKDTSESVAKRFVEKFLTGEGFVFDKVYTSQTGDYEDDWVDAYVTVTGLKESKVFESSMSDVDVISNIKLAIQTKDHLLMQSVLADLNDGDVITFDAKTSKGNVYNLMLLKKNPTTYIIKQVVKGEKESPKLLYINDAIEDMLYFPTMTGGAFPTVKLIRA